MEGSYNTNDSSANGSGVQIFSNMWMSLNPKETLSSWARADLASNHWQLRSSCTSQGAGRLRPGGTNIDPPLWAPWPTPVPNTSTSQAVKATLCFNPIGWLCCWLSCGSVWLSLHIRTLLMIFKRNPKSPIVYTNVTRPETRQETYTCDGFTPRA